MNPEELHGRTRPFVSQPVQGFSGLLRDPTDPNVYLALVDNGFGAIENSSDSLLRAYRVKPDFKTGRIEVLSFIQLSDPDRKIPFAIVNEWTSDRVLTGADFDVESFQRADDGTLWFGDEFGPFLLHTDATGRVLDPPYPLTDFTKGEGALLLTPQSPLHEQGALLRVLNAMRADALAHGAPVPIVSPWHVMIDDGSRIRRPERPDADPFIQIDSLRKAGFEVIPYTVNEATRIGELVSTHGARGIITDLPQLGVAIATLKGWRTEDGLIDRTRFDLQGHRGARTLRPENTFPSFEAALDSLVTTLETDVVLTSDGVPVLGHDPVLEPRKCRRTDKKKVPPPVVRATPYATLLLDYVCDGVLKDQPAQKNDPKLSPVSVLFSQQMKQMRPYSLPKLEQLFAFADFYAEYYETGRGKDHPRASTLAKNARAVRFNVETKVNPLPSAKDTSPDADAITDAIIEVVQRRGLEPRVDLQSFDWRTLRRVYEKAPKIRTVCLIGDFAAQGQGNLAPDERGHTPWLAGLKWPYRASGAGAMVQKSGGFEGMAYLRAENALVPMLEKPLVGSEKRELIASRFDLGTKQYTAEEFRFPLGERGVGVGDFQMEGVFRGYALERDDTQGQLDGYKRLIEFRVDEESGSVTRRDAADLLALQNGLTGEMVGRQQGDVGLDQPFAFPFWTIESLVLIDETHVLIANDNNYPYSVGRHVGTNDPDHTEFIVVELPAR